MRVQHTIVTDGFNGHAEAILAEDRMKVQMNFFEVIDVPARAGDPQYDAEGKIIEWRKPLIVELEWQRLHAVVDRGTNRGNKTLKNMAAYRRLFELEREFPNSKNALEACEQAGIDWREFKFGTGT